VTVVPPTALEAEPPVGPAAAAPRPPRPRLLDVTAIVAALGVLAALAGVIVLALPVRSPLQDCGSTFSFLYDGRTDTLGDPANPPKGATKADVEATNARPCRPRVAARAKVAAILLLGGLAVAFGSIIVEVGARIVLRRRSANHPFRDVSAPLSQ
jgi:hypothetical protein